jgi:hypothetical protein
MAVHCVVFELRRERGAYEQFFRHLDNEQTAAVGENCRLLFSRHSPEAIQTYLQNFIFSGDLLLVVESSNRWALNRGFEATEWLRELQHLEQLRSAREGSC